MPRNILVPCSSLLGVVYYVHAPDRAGFGHSDDDDNNKTLVHDKQAEDLWEMMMRLTHSSIASVLARLR